MNTPNEHIPPNPGKRMLIAMISIGLICALLIVLTFEFTLPVIKKNQAEALDKAIYQVIPGIDSTRTFVWSAEAGLRPATATSTGEKVYVGYAADGSMQGFAIEASGQGYADIIRVLYGYRPGSQTVIGIAVLETKETPGLGDKIEKDPDFLKNFEALDVRLNAAGDSLANAVTTVKHGEKTDPWQIDGITGATISSRAIGNIVNSSAAVWIPRIVASQSNDPSTHKSNE